MFYSGVLGFVLAISILVFIHEMGHYLVARLAGVRVLSFSVGMGPELFGWNDKRGTRWRVSLLPIGGYVQMEGFLREDVQASSTTAYLNKPVLWRMAIIAAGPFANILLAVAIMGTLYWLNGTAFFEAIQHSFVTVWTWCKLIAGAIVALFGGSGLENLGGPIAIGSISGTMIERGVEDFAFFLAIMSVNLGLINLLPIKPLDGGHLLVDSLRLVRIPVSARLEETFTIVGVLLVLGLMVFILGLDIWRLF